MHKIKDVPNNQLPESTPNATNEPSDITVQVSARRRELVRISREIAAPVKKYAAHVEKSDLIPVQPRNSVPRILDIKIAAGIAITIQIRLAVRSR
jgi:hypothetical protein